MARGSVIWISVFLIGSGFSQPLPQPDPQYDPSCMPPCPSSPPCQPCQPCQPCTPCPPCQEPCDPCAMTGDELMIPNPNSPDNYCQGQAPPQTLVVKPGKILTPQASQIVVRPGQIRFQPLDVWVRPAPVQPKSLAPIYVTPPPVTPPQPPLVCIKPPPVCPPKPKPILVRPPSVIPPKPAPIRVQPSPVQPPPTEPVFVQPPKILVPQAPTVIFHPNTPSPNRVITSGTAYIKTYYGNVPPASTQDSCDPSDPNNFQQPNPCDMPIC